MQDLYAEFKAVIQVLNSKQIPYAVCGGLAYAIHVEARATVDMDFLISPQDVGRAVGAIKSLGYTVHPRRISSGDGTFVKEQLWKVERGGDDVLSVDLLLLDAGVGSEIWEGRQRLVWEDEPLWVVSWNGLLLLKRLRGTKQDLADIEKLTGPHEPNREVPGPNLPPQEIETGLRMTSQLRTLCLDLHRAFLRGHETYPLTRLRRIAKDAEGQGRSPLEIAVGFSEAWCAGDHHIIVAVGKRLPVSFFEADPDIQMYFDLAQERLTLSSEVATSVGAIGDSAG